MTTISISVIICTWNRCKLLAETLKTLQCQKNLGLHEIETIIIDNNSSDQTASVVRDFIADWPLGKLYYLYESKQGKQFALNLGIKKSSGEVLAFTDDDVILPDDWILNILKIFGNSQVELVGGKTLLLWPDNLMPIWFKASMLAVVAGVDLGDKILFPPPFGYAPAGTNFIVRRSLFDRIGLFSETHYRHMDYEFGIRAANNKAVVKYDPTLVVFTQVLKGVLNKRYFRRWYFKLGIATVIEAQPLVPMFFGVPRWVWRQLIEDILAVLFYKIRYKANEKIFEREVHAIQLIGWIASIWHKKLWPSTHEKWVERWSQKRGVDFG